MRRSARGYLYRAIDSEGFIKVGFSMDPRERVRTLSATRKRPVTLLGVTPGDRKAEARLHRRLSAWRQRGEWYFPTSELLDLIAHINRKAPPGARMFLMVRLPPDLYRRFAAFCEREGKTMTETVVIALTEWMDMREASKAREPAR